MLLALLGHSQDNGLRIPEQEHWTLGVYADYADDKQGGYGIDYVIESGYSGFVEAKLGIESFEKLYGGYFDVHGAIGFKLVHGYDEQWQYYFGGRMAVVWRGGEGAYRAVPGIEAQWKWYIGDGKIAIGVRWTFDHRYDMEIFNWPVVNVHSGFITVTYKIKSL